MNRYSKVREADISDELFQMSNSRKRAGESEKFSSLIGYEGTAARYYFKGLSKCIRPEFAFSARTRRPPLDPFNSMISLGYSVLMNCFYEEIENHGLNPYFGYMHRDSEKHPTLASDMIEEWRAVIVDSTVMSLINGNEIGTEQFYYDEESGGCFILREGLNIYLKKLDRKIRTESKYLSYVDYSVSFRRAIGLQVGRLRDAILEQDATIYTPIRIR